MIIPRLVELEEMAQARKLYREHKNVSLVSRLMKRHVQTIIKWVDDLRTPRKIATGQEKYRLWSQGLTDREIADALGLRPSDIGVWRYRHDPPLPRNKSPIKQFRIDAYQRGLSDEEIAREETERFKKKTSIKAIQHWRKVKKLPPNSPKEHQVRLTRWKERRKLYDEGLSDLEIAAKEGVSRKVISGWREYYNLPLKAKSIRTKPKSRIKKWEGAERFSLEEINNWSKRWDAIHPILIKKYPTKKALLDEISKICNVNASQHWLGTGKPPIIYRQCIEDLYTRLQNSEDYAWPTEWPKIRKALLQRFPSKLDLARAISQKIGVEQSYCYQWFVADHLPPYAYASQLLAFSNEAKELEVVDDWTQEWTGIKRELLKLFPVRKALIQKLAETCKVSESTAKLWVFTPKNRTIKPSSIYARPIIAWFKTLRAPTYSKRELERKMQHLYEEDFVDMDIALALGISTSTVREWRLENSLYQNHKKFRQYHDDFVRYYQQGINDIKIAKLLGIGRDLVLSWRRNHNLPALYRGRPPKRT